MAPRRRPSSTRSGSSTRSAPRARARPAVLYIDLHLVHEVTSPQAFSVLRERGPAGAPSRAHPRDHGSLDPDAHRAGLRRRADRDRFRGAPGRASSRRTAREFGVELLALRHAQRGIVHVIGPELGLTPARARPSSAATATRAPTARSARSPSASAPPRSAHVLATQCLLQRKPRTFAVNVEGALQRRRHRQGPDPRHHRPDRRRRAAPGTCIEYRGATMRALDMDGAHDRVQHVDRGRRARRHDRPRRDHLRVSRGPPARARRARPGSGP